MRKIRKYFCYYCQKNIRPSVGLKGRLCPHCGCYLIDENTDFFRVCDKCGANLPTDAAVCLLCGYHFSGENAKRVYHFKRSIFFRVKESKHQNKGNIAIESERSGDYSGYLTATVVGVLLFIFLMWLLLWR